LFKKRKKINYIIFSGKVENKSIDSLGLYDKNNQRIKTIYLSQEKTFNNTLIIPSGYYSLNDNNLIKTIFLKPKSKVTAVITYI
jgi:hypothetical protein